MATHFKDKQPEVWVEVLATCEQAARDGLTLSKAQKMLRHHGFTPGSLTNWVKDGLIPSYTYEGPRKFKPSPSVSG